MNFGDKYTPSEDMFAETRMSFGEHIDDLRKHLLRAITWLCVFVVISFFPIIGKNVLHFIAKPVEDELTAYWDRYYQMRSKQVREELAQGSEDLKRRNQPVRVAIAFNRHQLFQVLGLKDPKKAVEEPFDIKAAVEPILRNLDLEDWLAPTSGSDANRVEVAAYIQDPLSFYAGLNKNQTVVGRRPALTTLNVQEAFMVYIKVCFMTGLVLASPMVFYQLWSFVAAGLYPHEKRYVNLYLPFSIGLFLFGVFVCEIVVIPKAVAALLWFNEWLGMEPDLRLNEWLGFAIFMPVLFGISFQTPLVMLFIERMGVLTVDSYRKARRIAYFILTAFVVVAVPSTDFMSMFFLLGPLVLLYELGIVLCRMVPRRPQLEIEVPESEEMVEV